MLRVYLYMFLGWLVFTASALLVRRSAARKYMLRASYVVFLLFCAEAACVFGFYIKNHRWTFADQRSYLRQLHDPHPYLVAVPKKNAHVTFRGISYTHNSQGFRGRDIPPKSDRLRIVAVGGSTTYGAAVSDEQTWPVQLEARLGEDYEVLNFGILGHGTAEHINLLSLVVPEYKPDMLVLYVGLNDLRNIHVGNLSPDYSDYHAPTLFISLGLCSDDGPQRFASGKVAVWLLQRLKVYPECALGNFRLQEASTPEAEDDAKRIYRRNLETLVAVAKSQGLKPILVPQVLVREKFQGGKLKWWIPFVEDDQLIPYLNQYNAITEEVARREGLYFAREVTEQNWTAEDFADPSHFSASGNQKFAGLLQQVVLKLKEQDYRTGPV
jgi:lysophospholipase L1-like esterase